MQVPPQKSAFESVTDNRNSKFWTTIESFGIITIGGKVAKVNEMRDVQVIEFGISNTPVGIVTKPVPTYIIYHLNDLHLRYVDDAKMFCFHGEMYFVQGVVDGRSSDGSLYSILIEDFDLEKLIKQTNLP